MAGRKPCELSRKPGQRDVYKAHVEKNLRIERLEAIKGILGMDGLLYQKTKESPHYRTPLGYFKGTLIESADYNPAIVADLEALAFRYDKIHGIIFQCYPQLPCRAKQLIPFPMLQRDNLSRNEPASKRQGKPTLDLQNI
jgi:hypothetical protein